MNLFKKQKPVHKESPFSPDRYEPVIRSSICTGEMTACMRNRETGKLHEVMIIRYSDDKKQFAEEYGVNPDSIRTVY